MFEVLSNVPGPVSNTRSLRSRHWLITINNFTTEDESNVKKWEKYVYQIEKGSQGTRHIQGYLSSKHQLMFSSVKKVFPKAHIEKCFSPKASQDYCMKSETRVRGPYSNYIDYPKDLFVMEDMKDWQEEIISLVQEEPDIRTINWYWSYEGGIGKTLLAKHLALNYGAIVIGGKASDMKYAIAQCEVKPKICILNLSRTTAAVSYEGLEQIKDGLFFSAKYESGMCVYDCPHVIVTGKP